MGKVLYVCRNKIPALWVRLRDGRAYDLFVESGYSLPPELWNNKTQRIKPRFIETEEFTQNRARELINNLNTLKSVVLNALNDSAGQAPLIKNGYKR